MNFTDSPFERMMKQIPRQGRGGAAPCWGPAAPPRHKPKKKPDTYRDIIITSGQTPTPQSLTALRGTPGSPKSK